MEDNIKDEQWPRRLLPGTTAKAQLQTRGRQHQTAEMTVDSMMQVGGPIKCQEGNVFKSS